LYLLQKSKSRSTYASEYDFYIKWRNCKFGVIVAGGLVYLTNSKYPDLIVGTIVFFIVGQGAFKILKLSKWRNEKEPLLLTAVTVAQLPFLEILFPKHKILTSFNHF
jgi:hypothetical protein